MVWLRSCDQPCCYAEPLISELQQRTVMNISQVKGLKTQWIVDHLLNFKNISYTKVIDRGDFFFEIFYSLKTEIGTQKVVISFVNAVIWVNNTGTPTYFVRVYSLNLSNINDQSHQHKWLHY